MNARYKQRNDYPVWNLSVGQTPWNQLDPMIEYVPLLNEQTRIGNLGCCFAQRVAKFLKHTGYNFYIAEPQPNAETLFSARYGNQYSPRHALQLIKRAYGSLMVPNNIGAWRLPKTDQWVDAFRPSFADPCESPSTVAANRQKHYECVRNVIENTEVLFYSVTSTECWISQSTGLAYSTTPGVAAICPDPTDPVFTNFTVADLTSDLDVFIRTVSHINPLLKIILAVSPHPLAATYEENQHVLVANSYSKSALRAAVGEICTCHSNVYYFPAYEIVCTPYTAARLFRPKLDTVNDIGITWCMRLFLRHFSDAANTKELATFVPPLNYDDVICDPE